MLGAIIGDIVGSVYEFNNIKTTEFELFTEKSHFTDDTVMTIAVAAGLWRGYDNVLETKKALIDSMRYYGRRFAYAGYGGRFAKWLISQDPVPYDSYGNGAAMRVSSVAWIYNNLEEIEKYAEVTASVTHNHPEGIKGAKSVAAAIFLARTGKTLDDIKSYITTQYGYDLSRTLDEIRPNYKFYESCQESVPEAITAFLESNSFEDSLRKAVSLGGDSDTIAAITGSIAEAFYGGIPEWIVKEALNRLDEPLYDIYQMHQSFLHIKFRWHRHDQAKLCNIS